MTLKLTNLALTAITSGLLIAAPVIAVPAMAATTVMVGGASMMSDAKIPENAAKASNLKTLVAALKAAGLVETLNGKGPFTVFAPTDAAFAKLPPGTVDKLVQPEMKPQLTAILTYHVVPGRLTAADLKADAMKHGGKATLKTVEGQTLTVEEKMGKWVVVDQAGHTATIETPDVLQSNGVVHVINTVLMPKS
ncbi:fasciclin domain-containing protein [Ancylobacter amanitiformis]|uniref:Surface protein with fasciclin (FAS1) repeats n=1 Tax=Ancylobacter amanitiformis TaxID=217069 RepID=A0ABU0LPV5_9HYPH|nr:fasciclin domain-containing protein [Ancylobacter amanitiformis]MDQ0510706.1 putative surface protein with fasciclin (FAS1) repeats [Ancylobacter amanitiformis]